MNTATLRNYRTRDINLATALKEAGIPLLRVEPQGHVGIFIFETVPEIEDVVARYFNGQLKVSAHSLFMTWRSLKAMTFSAVGNVR